MAFGPMELGRHPEELWAAGQWGRRP